LADFEKVYSIKFNTRKAQNSLEKMNKTLAKIEDNSKDVGKALEKGLGDKGVRATRKLNSHLKKTDGNLRRIRDGLKNFGRNMRRYVTLPILAAGAVSLKWARDLNKSMANVSTLLTGGRDQIEGFKRDVQSLAVETGKSTDDLAGGLYEVVSALGESNENMAQLGVAAKASVAGLASTNESVKLLSAVTKGYGDTSEEALKKASDLAFMTVKLGQTTFPELAASMGKAIPLAAALNTSQEELFATMATLTGVTGNTAEASTQIASVYSAMLKPTKELTAATNKLGFESAMAMVKEVGFRKSLILLNKAVDGNEGKLAKMLKRKEALVAALALLGGQSDVYEHKLGEMQKAVGATDDAYQKQTEGINAQGHAWEQTKQRMVVFAQRVGDKLLPIVSRLFAKLEPLLDRIEKMDDATLDMAINFAGLAAAIGPVIGLLGGFGRGMGGLASSVSTIAGSKSAMVGVAGAISKMATGLGVGIAAGSVGAALLKLLEFKAEKHIAKRETFEEAGLSAKRVARSETLTTEEKEAKLAELKSMHAAHVKSGGGTTIFDIPAETSALISGSERPSSAFKRIKKQGEAGIKTLGDRIKSEHLESWLSGQGGGGFQQSSPIINIGGTQIDVTGLDLPAVERAYDRKAKQRDRNVKDQIRQAFRQMTPAEF
jgi:TP901 family phage tail tape measure protein